ncbi:type IV pilus secretin PilQ [Vibrio hannami]|uniref:type IV pilus secretin PilQ n=1 Tax=Vibrio hannami TaxID=2717094 RepID=UPI00240FD6F1|nr:type IV pilus secretin PilQ [Vibrio hannami]MDG3084668.1 type IV pilus secretin PilQ [Vibrio hannami]
MKLDHSFVITLLLLSFAVSGAENEGSVNRSEENRISLNAQDMPVRNLLQAVADFKGLDLVVSDSVEGNISLNFENVPWEQALEVILHAKGLDKHITGNIILIAPKEDFGKRTQYEAEQTKLTQQFELLHSRVIRVHFANAVELAETLSSGSNVMSSRGALFVDSRTNSIIVRDMQSNLEEVSKMIAQLDIPIDQVQIEARLVTISEGDLEELGVRWGVSGSHGDTAFGGSLEGIHLQGDELSLDDMLNVNLGASSPNASGIAFSIGTLEGMLLDLELSALQSESRAEIISSPRLITANKKTAYIEQGTEIPYLEAASSGATSVSFKKAVLSLEVTPQITPNHQIVLDLKVTQNSPGETVRTGFGESVSIDTQRIGTQVLVNNGETIVLGGIYQYDLRTSVDKVPLLGDLPLLGNLFRRSYEVRRKKELMIFVTPKVISEQVM